MGIRRRLSKPKKLAYHQNYGSIEAPPFGPPVSNDYAINLYRKLCETVGPAKASEAVGHHAWGNAATVYVPETLSYPYRWPKGFKNLKGKRVIAGWLYERDRYIGPGSGFSCWAATKLGHTDYDRLICTVKGVNIFTDHEYIGCYPTRQKAHDAIFAKFEDRFNMILPS